MFTPLQQQRQKKINIGILGAGAFGTSLAIMFSHYFNVSLFSGFQEHVDIMRSSRRNEYLQDFTLPCYLNIDIIDNINNYGEFDYILWSFPTSPSIFLLKSLKPLLVKSNSLLILCSKGICETGDFLYNEFTRVLPEIQIGVLAGPNMAHDIAELKYSAADIGFKNLEIAHKAAEDLTTECFKIKPTVDITGIEIAGAVKNVIAVACGMARGLELGQNAFSVLLTKGLKEMTELGMAMDAKVETFYGLCGVGDLILTTSSKHSRNMNYGITLAKKEAFNSSAVCEGVECAGNLMKLCSKLSINLPVCKFVFKVIQGEKKAEDLIEEILI